MEKYQNPEEAVESLGLYGPLVIADFGAGGGYFTIPLAKKISKEGVVYALDILEAPLEVVRNKARSEHLYNIETMRADLERPHGSNLGNECADVVLVGHILFQAPEKEAIIAEAFRVLKKNGKLVVVEWSTNSLSLIGPKTSSRVSKEVIVKLLARVNFMIEKEFELGEHYFGIIARKHE